MTELESLKSRSFISKLTLKTVVDFSRRKLEHMLFYQKLQKNAICTRPHHVPTTPKKSDTKRDHAIGFSPLLTSKMPRLAAGDAEGSVRAGKPQCCGQTHISATSIFQFKGLNSH